MGLNSPKIQFWVLSRNRPEYLRETLLSASAQIAPGIEILVSDNSDNDDIVGMVASEFPHVKVIARRPVLPALTHFRVVLAEASAEYITLFHDDDVLLPGYFTELSRMLDQFPEASAAACDATIIRGDIPTSTLLIGSSKVDRHLLNSEQLLLPYLQFQRLGPAPFPAYMYRRSKIGGLCLNPLWGGKYADVSFLSEVARRGPILVSCKPLMSYRIHPGNDNASELVGSRLRLLRYLLTQTLFTRQSKAIRHFKFRYWSKWYRENQHERIHPNRLKVVRRFLVLNGLRLALTEPGFWLRFFNRARR